MRVNEQRLKSIIQGGVPLENPYLPYPVRIDKIITETEERIDVKTDAMGLVSISKELVDRTVAGDDRKETQSKQQEYWSEYFKRMDMRVYWGEAREFAGELRERWNRYKLKK